VNNSYLSKYDAGAAALSPASLKRVTHSDTFRKRQRCRWALPRASAAVGGEKLYAIVGVIHKE